MRYKCSFDFTVCRPKKSQFIGKSGELEINTDNPIPKKNMKKFMKDQTLLTNIAQHLAAVHKQKNIVSVTVKSLTLVEE